MSIYGLANLLSLMATIVVGAGIEGSSAAYQLVKKGARNVILLEQVMRHVLFPFMLWQFSLANQYAV